MITQVRSQKMDLSKVRKENVLVLMDAFFKFSAAVIMPNQQVNIVAKAPVDKWFNTYGIPTRIHSDQGNSLGNKIIHQLCKLYNI